MLVCNCCMEWLYLVQLVELYTYNYIKVNFLQFKLLFSFVFVLVFVFLKDFKIFVHLINQHVDYEYTYTYICNWKSYMLVYTYVICLFISYM